MEKVKLIVSRKYSFTGLVVPYVVNVNGQKAGSLMVGKSLELEIPNEPVDVEIILAASAVTPNATKKTIRIEPAKSPRGVVMLEFKIKGSLVGAFTGGIAKSVGSVVEEVRYL